MLPLFFQVVLLDSATTAGARLAIPSLATPIGGVIAGIVMSRWGRLIALVRTGALLMVVGNALVTSLGFEDSTWKHFVFVFPANLGQGIIYPGILFTSLASFDHAGKKTAPNEAPIRLTGTPRPRSHCLNRVSYPLARNCMGCISHLGHCANYAQRPVAGRTERGTR